MAFRIITSRRASKEIKNATEYYALYSNNAPIGFITREALIKDQVFNKENSTSLVRICNACNDLAKLTLFFLFASQHMVHRTAQAITYTSTQPLHFSPFPKKLPLS